MERARSPFVQAGDLTTVMLPTRTDSAMSASRAWTSTSASKAARASPSPAILDASARSPLPLSLMSPPTLLNPADVRRVRSAEPSSLSATPTKPEQTNPRYATLALPSGPLPHKRSATLSLAVPPPTSDTIMSDRTASLQIQVPQPRDIRRVPSLHVPQFIPLPAPTTVALVPSVVDESSLPKDRMGTEGDYEIVLPASSMDRLPDNLVERPSRDSNRGNTLGRFESDLYLPTSPVPMSGSLSPLSSSQE
ncbi:hypothetical protein BCR44DRAFT_372721 [Catenaria anguillulae PL171]|uniref:Uncharacterized protein n=1 Tax=Catenaria anguillulae PL171 TaxID=765915 RepID=A0A1Y2HS16_9FUNG|nr:hypothetical protein BCR44DRAFT_372721 [Catenaria anguillulae PL171]